MSNILKHFPLLNTYVCTELRGKRILVTGNKLIKIFSLETYEELKDIPSEDENGYSFMANDESFIFVLSNRGMKQYSFPTFSLIKVHEPISVGPCLVYLKNSNMTVTSDNFKLICLEMNTFTVIEFEEEHEDFISSIGSTSGEEFIFSTSLDKSLKKWSMDSLSAVETVDMESPAMSLLVREETGIILLGMANGSLAEYSIEDLLYIRTIAVHKNVITKITQLSNGDVMTSSVDGSVCLPFKNKVQVKVSDYPIYSFTELSDKTIACCFDGGLRIIFPPVQEDPLDETIDSISYSLESIRNSTSSQKSQLISLLQHHLVQLITPIQHQPEKFTGLALSLLPDLKFIQRSYFYEGESQGRKRILTHKYILEMVSSKSVIPETQTTLTLFDRKLKLLGKTINLDNPMTSLKIEKIQRGNWIFCMDDQTLVNPSHISGSATVHFLNGYLNCFIQEGDLINKSGFQNTLKVNGIVKKVGAVGNDGMVVTSDRKIYTLNFDANTIDEYLIY